SDTVSHGKKLGSTLGFPTVNLKLKPNVLPPALGVYATRVWLENGENHIAVTNVGRRPTVDDGETITVEGFILDFSGDLYGQKVRMEFYKFIRPEEKFPSLEALREEIMRNAQQTRDYFASQGQS
ncbi:MAG: riboflavin biosynthesis protein RibF, partial [Firmicutes bacterium]|nr:riboflavin biosynthesis protein RibF [Bacillota bacterium]